MDYKPIYLLLFNAVTDAIEALSQGDVALARKILICAQQQSEEVYISSGEERK